MSIFFFFFSKQMKGPHGNMTHIKNAAPNNAAQSVGRPHITYLNHIGVSSYKITFIELSLQGHYEKEPYEILSRIYHENIIMATFL